MLLPTPLEKAKLEFYLAEFPQPKWKSDLLFWEWQAWYSLFQQASTPELRYLYINKAVDTSFLMMKNP